MKKCLLLIVLMGLSGCASRLQPELSQDARATLGTIGVVSQERSSQFDYATPTTGVASGAGVGLKMWLAASKNCSQGGCIFFLPLFAIGGASYGGVAGESPEAVANAEAALKNSMAALKVQDMIRDQVFEVARQRTRHSLVLLQPAELSGPGGGPRYSALADKGITTVLEVGVSQIALVGTAIGHNPPMALVVNADVKLIRAKDGEVFYTLSLADWGSAREFLAWGANDGQYFRDEMTRMSQNLANVILGKVFYTDLLPPGWPPPPDSRMEDDPVKTEDKGADTDGSVGASE